jgi:benzoate membrane transport protein
MMELIPPNFALLRNIRALPQSFAVSSFLAGVVVVLIGFTSPLIIVLQAAAAAKLTPEQTSSWVGAALLGAGITAILMSLWFGQPVLGAWPTAGGALLVVSLPLFPFSEAIGAYLIAGGILVILGVTGLFERVMALVPQPIALGMLAGVLFRFGTGLFGALPERPVMFAVMIAAYYISQRGGFRSPTIPALIGGVIVEALSGDIQLKSVMVGLTTPVFTAPTFSLNALLGLAIPLVMVVLVSQYAPGLAVLRVSGYRPAINRILVTTGIFSLLGAPFGSHGTCLSAVTAAIASMPEAHPDPHKRYTAGVSTGVLYTISGLIAVTVVSIFSGLPPVLIAAVAGLALTPTLMTAINGAVSDSRGREGGLVALLCAAANISFLGIGGTFWALVIGVLVDRVVNWQRVTEETT